MRFRFTHLTLVLIISILLAGCDDGPSDIGQTRAVIEAYISQDGTPEVFFTKSVNPSQSGSLSDVIVRWGKVTVSDGAETVIMTGGPLKGSFPPFHYYTPMMTGKAGKTYTITAEYEDIRATATATIPVPTPIDSIVVRPVEGCDTLCSAALWFTAPDDVPAYYYITVLEDRPGARPLPSNLGAVSVDRPGIPVSMPVYRPKYKYGAPKNYVAQLRRGARYAVTLCRVEKEVYNFWNGYDNIVAFGGAGQLLSSSVSLTGNMLGAYGVFSAQGQSRIVITAQPMVKVPDSQTQSLGH